MAQSRKQTFKFVKDIISTAINTYGAEDAYMYMNKLRVDGFKTGEAAEIFAKFIKDNEIFNKVVVYSSTKSSSVHCSWEK